MGARRAYLAPTAAAFLILAPLLGPGVAIAYDMPWSPQPRWTPFVLGLDTPAPRAVPSDAFAVLVGTITGAGAAQLLILAGILLSGAGGTISLLAHLAPRSSTLARAATGIAAVWNPYVIERLAVGQWAVLLGYALVPWAILASLRARRGSGVLPVACVVGLAGIGGANAVVVVAITTLLVLLAPRPRWRGAFAVTTVAAGVSAAWAIPALTSAAARSSAVETAFLPRPDTPLGLVLSVVSGGAFWNPASWPAGRSTGLNAVAATFLAVAVASCAFRRLMRPSAGRAFAVAALVGLAVVVLSALPLTSVAWAEMARAVPGGGILRDSQKLLAPWVVLLSIGAGLLADRLPVGERGRALLGASLVVLPIALLPGGTWGIGGRLEPVVVPKDYLAVAARLSAAEPGVVGVLPWRQYRRYEWNDRRVSLTILPRVVDQPTVYDDSLPLASGVVPGEDVRAARVTRAIDDGVAPFSALRGLGVRYVAVEKSTGLPEVVPPADARLVIASDELDVYELSASQVDEPSTNFRAVRVGWALSATTWLLLSALALRRGVRSRSYR